MSADIVSVILRGLGFVALFQAIGLVLFIAAFGGHANTSMRELRRIGWIAMVFAASLLAAHDTVEAARMAGDWSGIFDSSMQRMAFLSMNGAVLGLRVAGLGLAASALLARAPWMRPACSAGALLVALSFALIGHTTVGSHRVFLTVSLTIHVLIIAFWFGSLLPMRVIAKHQAPSEAAAVIQAFSVPAAWLVPIIFLAGLAMAAGLVPSLDVFRTPYGVLLLGKAAGFGVLMGLAALNKWRLGPAVGTGHPAALHRFRQSLALEYIMIAVVLITTAVMTGLYSPDA